MARDILQHHDGVVHHEAGGHRQGHQGDVVDGETGQGHDRERPEDRDRHDDRRDQRHACVTEEKEDHQRDEEDRKQQRALDLVQGAADGDGTVHRGRHLHALGNLSLQVGDLGFDTVDGLDDVRAGLARDDQHNRRAAVEQAGVTDVLDRQAHRGEVGEPHRRRASVADDQRQVIRGLQGLVVRHHLPATTGGLDDSFGRIDIRGGEGLADVLKRDAVGGQLGGVHVHADGRQGRTTDVDIPHPGDLGDARREHGRRDVIHLATGEAIRRDGQQHDRHVRGIRLTVARAVDHRRRQHAARCADGRLDFAGRAIDIPGKVELQGDVRIAARARGRDLRHAGDTAERTLQGGRDRRGHGLRAGARDGGTDFDRGKINLRQGRNWEFLEGEQTREHDTDRQQRGRDRPADEERGQVHGDVAAARRRCRRSNQR